MEPSQICTSTATAFGVIVALIIWKLFTKPKVKQYNKSRALSPLEMQAVSDHSKNEGQTVSAFHIISKQPLRFAILKKAATIVAQSQPLLKACIRLKPYRGRTPWFLPMDKLEYDIHEETSGDWEAEMEHQMSFQFKESSGPLWRLVFLPNAKIQKAEGEFLHESVIILACHHAIVDGVSVMRLLAQIMKTINKIQEGTDDPYLPSMMIYAPIEEMIDFQGFIENLISQVISVSSSLLKILPRWMIADRLKSSFIVPNPFFEKYGIEKKKNPLIPVGTSILPLELSCEETRSLLLACRRNGATIQGAAIAATNVAMEKLLLNGTSETEINLQTMIMINAKPFLSVQLPNNAMGAYSYSKVMPINVKKDQQASFWKSAKSISEEVRKNVNRGVCIWTVNLYSFIINLENSRLSPEQHEESLGPAFVNIFSNAGNCKYVNEEGASVKAVAGHSAVAQNRVAPSYFKHYITTVDNRLCWTLVFTKRYVSIDIAESVGKGIISSLLRASSE